MLFGTLGRDSCMRFSYLFAPGNNSFTYSAPLITNIFFF